MNKERRGQAIKVIPLARVLLSFAMIMKSALARCSTCTLAAAWILSAGVIGLMTNVSSIGAASLVLGFAIVPPFFLLMLRQQPVAVRVR